MEKHKNGSSLYEMNNSKIWIERKRNCLYFLWDGFLTSDQYREIAQKSIDIVSKNNLKYWVWDLCEMSVLAQDDIAWTINVWYPEWQKCGLKAVYIIEPQQTFGRSSFKKIINRQIIEAMKMKFFLSKNMVEMEFSKQ